MFTSMLAATVWIASIVGIRYLLDIGIILSIITSTIIFYLCVFIFRVEKPKICTQFHSDPHRHIAPYLSSTLLYRPALFLWNRYFETIIPEFINVPIPFETTQEMINVTAQNQSIHLDGQCSITWSPHTTDHQLFPETSPILIIVPGLTGDITAKYCRRMMITAHQNGWQSVIFNPRGRGNVPFRTPQAYSVGYTEDLRQTLRFIRNKYPRRPLFGVGYSLGSNYLALYQGQEGKDSLLTAAVCCAVPTDPLVCNAALQRRPMVDRLLAHLLKKVMVVPGNLELFGKRFRCNVNKTIRCTTLRQFDHYMIAPQFGMKSGTDYYRKSSAGYVIGDIEKPTLFLYARNDIMVPIDVFCPEDYDGNEHICAVVTRYGSHSMSWMEGMFQWTSWQSRITMEYLKAAFVLESKQNLQRINQICTLRENVKIS